MPGVLGQAAAALIAAVRAPAAPAPAPSGANYFPRPSGFVISPGSPASGGFGPEQAATALGSALGGPLWGASFGSFFKPKDPPFPVELDPQTGRAYLLSSTGSRITAFLGARGREIAGAFEATWSTGAIPADAPKKYRPQLELLLSRRGSYFGGSNMAGGIPPGGFAGFAQMTPASQLALGGKRTTRKKRRKGAKRQKRAKTKRKSKAARKGKKLIKGSKAAKARMAKLRRMRK